ncbi:MAG TPA: sulfurtransferase [Gemmatimonadales bacterium]|nr:sulfurtransferase [Gemmatimonadales bacterium]
MRTGRRRCVSALLGAALLGCGAGGGAGPGEAPPAPTVISTDSLATLLDRASILDVRTDFAAYLRSHVPGAVYLNTETLRAAAGGIPNLLLPGESYRTLFGRLGVTHDRPVVIYSAGETRNIDATYVAWILAGFGHSRVHLLDGGFGKWEAEHRPTSRRYPRVPMTRFTGRPFRPERVGLEEVRRALGRPGVVIVDARSPEQYRGEAGPQMRRGHIPGAVNHHWQSDLARVDFAVVWRPVEELRRAYAGQGITPDREILVYCNGGLESSHVHFALRYLLGYPRVRVYDGSFTEWAEREELPVERSAIE